MATENKKQLKIVEVCKIYPSTKENQGPKELSIDLTYFDLKWLRFPSPERLFFYKLNGRNDNSESNHFYYSTLLPKLKHSLSEALLYFLPLAGHIMWPSPSCKPTILWSPDDAVLLTIAEEDPDVDMDQFTSIGMKTPARNLHPYVPELEILDTRASMLAVQVTLFPDKGFCVGIMTHHAGVDGKGVIMFVKAWAHLCKSSLEQVSPLQLPPELTPVLDRTIVKDTKGLEELWFNDLAKSAKAFSADQGSLKVIPFFPSIPEDLVRATFHFTSERIDKLRQHVFTNIGTTEEEHYKQHHLSTFVLTCAYLLYCLVKVHGDYSKRICFIFSADYRRFLEPPLPSTYFGNCVGGHMLITEAKVVEQSNGFTVLALKLSEKVRKLKEQMFEGVREWSDNLRKLSSEGALIIGVAGSPRFGSYEADFGLGRPEKVDIVSVDKTRSIALMDARDDSDGIQVGLALNSHEMESFSSLFTGDL